MAGFNGLCSTQPQLSYWKGDPTANVRVNCLNREAITVYFALLTEENQALNQWK